MRLFEPVSYDQFQTNQNQVFSEEVLHGDKNIALSEATSDIHLARALSVTTTNTNKRPLILEAIKAGANVSKVLDSIIYIDKETLVKNMDILLSHNTANSFLSRLIREYSYYESSLPNLRTILNEFFSKGGNLTEVFKRGDRIHLDTLIECQDLILHEETSSYYLFHVLKGNSSKTRELILSALAKGANINAVLECLSDFNSKTLYENADLLLNKETSSSFLQATLYSSNIDNQDFAKSKDILRKALDLVDDATTALRSISPNTLFEYQDALLNRRSANAFLKAGARYGSNEGLEMAKNALKAGADVNFIDTYDTAILAEAERSHGCDSELSLLLKSLGASCGQESWRVESFMDDWSYFKIEYLAYEVAKITLHNLSANPADTNKIPYILHHIWLTSASSPREIKEANIKLLTENKLLFERDHGKWTHIVWVNDMTVIPKSIKSLIDNGFEIRVVTDYLSDLQLIEQIYEAMDRKAWGLASDMLRYSIMLKFGGVYSDINYRFSRSIEEELYKYDFVSVNFINNFLAAKPNHPIFIKIANHIKLISDNPPIYLKEFTPDSGILVETILKTLSVVGLSYMSHSNLDNNIDIIYPVYYKDSYNHKYYEYDPCAPYTCDQCQDSYALIERLPCLIKICLGAEYAIGIDGATGDHLSWIE